MNLGSTMDILEAISRRMSVRTYESGSAPMAELEGVRLAGERAEALTQVEMRFYLRSHQQMGHEVKGIIGNYGKYIHAPHYIVLASKEGEGYLTDAGFRFEQMVLEATRNGLGTCWVGLMFKEASLRSNLGLDKSWRVMVLTPIGRAGDPSFVSRSLRAMAGSSTRKPLEEIFFWQSYGTRLPANVLADERMARVLEAARRAPSWMNKQPWRFILNGREILVYKMKNQEREGKDYHLLDCGIAMANLHLAARAVGMDGHWKLARFEVPGQAEAEPVGKYILKDANGS
jgi:nitroreductase